MDVRWRWSWPQSSGPRRPEFPKLGCRVAVCSEAEHCFKASKGLAVFPAGSSSAVFSVELLPHEGAAPLLSFSSSFCFSRSHSALPDGQVFVIGGLGLD